MIANAEGNLYRLLRWKGCLVSLLGEVAVILFVPHLIVRCALSRIEKSNGGGGFENIEL